MKRYLCAALRCAALRCAALRCAALRCAAMIIYRYFSLLSTRDDYISLCSIYSYKTYNIIFPHYNDINLSNKSSVSPRDSFFGFVFSKNESRGISYDFCNTFYIESRGITRISLSNKSSVSPRDSFFGVVNKSSVSPRDSFFVFLMFCMRLKKTCSVETSFQLRTNSSLLRVKSLG